jgi:hypothetical protein
MEGQRRETSERRGAQRACGRIVAREVARGELGLDRRGCHISEDN